MKAVGADSKLHAAFLAYSPYNPNIKETDVWARPATHRARPTVDPEWGGGGAGGLLNKWVSPGMSSSQLWIMPWPFTLLEFRQRETLIQLVNQYPENIRAVLAILFLLKVIILWHFNAFKWHKNNSNEIQQPKINEQIDVRSTDTQRGSKK